MADFITRLRAGQVRLGVQNRFPSTGLLEVLCPGWDFLWVDGQHGQLDYPAVLHAIQTAERLGLATVVRVPGHEECILGPYADLAPDALMIPMVDTEAQARAIVRALRYPPLGNRSFGGERALAAGGMARAERLGILAQIETPEGAEAAAAIAAVEGVDGLFLGLEDLKLRLGLPIAADPWETPALEPHLRGVAAAALRHGKFAGCIAKTPDTVRRAMELGYRFITCGGDSGMIHAASAALRAELAAVVPR